MLDEMVKIFDQSEIEHVGNKDIRGCIACISCKARLGHCVFDDCINAIDDQKFEEADGFVVGTPDYYGSAKEECSYLMIVKNLLGTKRV